MATLTITIANDIVAEALAAATDINQRLPAKERQPEPLTFTDKEAADIISPYLNNLILTNLNQANAITSEAAAYAKLQDLAARRTAAAP